jgi:hypothetical protein
MTLDIEANELCGHCGEEMVTLGDGTTRHVDAESPTGYDHDADEDHVAVAEDLIIDGSSIEADPMAAQRRGL